MWQGMREVQGVEGRRWSNLSQSRFVGKQSENVLDIVTAAKSVFHELIRETLALRAVVAVFLILT